MIQPGLKDAILNKRMGNREVKTHPPLGLVSFQFNSVKMEFTYSSKLVSDFVPFRKAAHQGFHKRETQPRLELCTSQGSAV